MGRPKKTHLGKPSVHNGSERVWWNGRWHDLGPVDSPEARAEYARLAAIWASDPTALPLRAGDYLICDLIADFLASADSPPDGPQRYRYARVAELLVVHHAETAVADFGPLDLRSWQDWLCRERWADGKRTGELRFCRTYIGDLVSALRRVWAWGVASERVAVEKYQALLTVPGPQRGKARESKVVEAADPDAVQATLKHLRPTVRAMVLLQMHTGARPSEICQLRPVDVIRSGRVRIPGGGWFDTEKEKVWVVLPKEHKTAAKGKTRVLHFGKPAQDLLRPFLERDAEEYCFRPRETLTTMRDEQRADRLARGGGSGGNRKAPTASPKSRPGERYTARGYRQAVERAAIRAGVEHWTPYQLRHLAAEEIYERFGADAAADVLGHSDPKTTRRYAKARGAAKRAAKVARSRKA